MGRSTNPRESKDFMRKKKHTHKYERRRLGSWKKTGHEIYKCAAAGCNHYIIDLETVVGRYSQCWGPDCGNEVEMTRYLIFSEKRKRPICDDCKERRKIERMTPAQREVIDSRMAAIDRAVAAINLKNSEVEREDDVEVYDE